MKRREVELSASLAVAREGQCAQLADLEMLLAKEKEERRAAIEARNAEVSS